MDAVELRTVDLDKTQKWFRMGLLAFFVLLSVQYTGKVAFSESENRSAFLRWRDQVLDLDDGTNIYDEHNYPNPPVMALLLRPLMSLPPVIGSLTWFYLKVAMVFLVFRWVFALVEESGHTIPIWAKLLTIVLSLRPIMGDLSHGNINIFILLLVIGALYCYRRERDFLAGLLLALSIACKVTPALFVPYFVWKRAWKTLAGCGVGLALFLLVLPGLYLGMERNAYLVAEWADQMIVPFVIEGEVTSEHQNQSLPGFLHRMLTPSASFSEYNGDHYVPVEYHNITSIAPIYLRLTLKICMLAFAGLVLWTCTTKRDQRQSWRYAAEFSLVLLGMLIFSERTWKHHCVILILPFAVMIYALAKIELTARTRRIIIWGLVVACLFFMSTSTGVFGKSITRLGKLSQVYGAYLWAHFLLLTCIVVLLRATRAGIQWKGDSTTQVFLTRAKLPLETTQPTWERNSTPADIPTLDQQT